MTCVFCRIVSGDESAHLVIDDDHVVAFLDRTPLFIGHTLVVPRAHHETLADLPVHEIGGLFERVRRLSAVIPAAMGAQGAFVASNQIVSQSVPHLHVHVVPRTKGDGLKGFFWPRTRYDNDEQMAEVAARLRHAFEHYR